MTVEHPSIDSKLVRQLVAAQFPQWADLSIRPVFPGGWDHKTFRLGDAMAVRLPSAAAYAAQVAKEHRWLPRLAPWLPLPIPAPLALGEPTDGYPWPWSVYRWLEGDTASHERVADLRDFATGLARFVVALQRIDPTGGPAPGAHNFHRGGSLKTYDGEARQAIATLAGRIDVDAATGIWDAALASTWHRAPVWVHGDLSAGNLLVQEGRLSSVIDFGTLCTGDPACDLSIAWTLLVGESREAFRSMLPLDEETWARARGWTLWKALIGAAGLSRTNATDAAQAQRVLDVLLGSISP